MSKKRNFYVNVEVTEMKEVPISSSSIAEIINKEIKKMLSPGDYILDGSIVQEHGYLGAITIRDATKEEIEKYNHLVFARDYFRE